jgi:hypothetical protein
MHGRSLVPSDAHRESSARTTSAGVKGFYGSTCCLICTKLACAVSHGCPVMIRHHEEENFPFSRSSHLPVAPSSGDDESAPASAVADVYGGGVRTIEQGGNPPRVAVVRQTPEPVRLGTRAGLMEKGFRTRKGGEGEWSDRWVCMGQYLITSDVLKRLDQPGPDATIRGP